MGNSQRVAMKVESGKRASFTRIENTEQDLIDEKNAFMKAVVDRTLESVGYSPTMSSVTHHDILRTAETAVRTALDMRQPQEGDK